MDQLYSTITNPNVTFWTPLAIVGVVLAAASITVSVFACVRYDPGAWMPGMVLAAITLFSAAVYQYEAAESDQGMRTLATYVQDRYDVVPIEKASFSSRGGAWFRAVNDDGETVYVTATWTPPTDTTPVVQGTDVPDVKHVVTFTIDDTQPATWRELG